MKALKVKARQLINEFKGDEYIYGIGCLHRIGELLDPFRKKILLITSLDQRDPESYTVITQALRKHEMIVVGKTPSSRPNTPREDVLRMKASILDANPDCVLVASGGSGIDAAKAALVLAELGGDFDDYFGTGKVTQKLQTFSPLKKLLPLFAVQTAAGSSAHLSKYSNITDLKTHQKKLIVDDAIIPPMCLFDYGLTTSTSPSLTSDGAFDSMAHLLEVYYGAGPETIDLVEEIALAGIELIIQSLPTSLAAPSDLQAREALGLGADLGGYAIMVGGTNGAHLTSFSLVDILSHGRACALLNPYYTVFFAPAIQRHLKQLAQLMAKYDLFSEDPASLAGRELGLAVAQALTAFSRRVGFPTHLGEIKGMTATHLKKALEAAKNPQLEMKLKNMPVPLTPDMLNEYMKPILEAALSGDFSRIKNLDQ